MTTARERSTEPGPLAGVRMIELGTLLAGDTAARVLGIGFLPIGVIGETMLWVAEALTLVTGWDYLRAGLRHAEAQDTARAAKPPGHP